MRRQSTFGAVLAGFGLVLLASTPALAEDGTTFLVDTRTDSIDAAPGDGICADATGACSLRAAVQEANASGGGEIGLPRGNYLLTIGEDDANELATGDLDVTSAITINGNGARIDANGLGSRVLDVSVGARLKIDGSQSRAVRRTAPGYRHPAAVSATPAS